MCWYYIRHQVTKSVHIWTRTYLNFRNTWVRPQCFAGPCCSIFDFLCCVFKINVCLFVRFLFDHSSSVHLRFVASSYLSGFFIPLWFFVPLWFLHTSLVSSYLSSFNGIIPIQNTAILQTNTEQEYTQNKPYVLCSPFKKIVR